MGVTDLNSTCSTGGALTDVEETCTSCTALPAFSWSPAQEDDHRFALKQAHQMGWFLALSDTHLRGRSHSRAGDYTLRIMHSSWIDYLFKLFLLIIVDLFLYASTNYYLLCSAGFLFFQLDVWVTHGHIICRNVFPMQPTLTKHLKDLKQSPFPDYWCLKILNPYLDI